MKAKIKTTKTKPTLKELLACRSVQAIVALMKRYGIKGKPGDPRDCPMARYVRRTGVRGPCVRSNGCCTTGFLCSTDETIFPASRIRRAFVMRVDTGQLPELVLN